MKVTCQLCGTKFDKEINCNTCPECGAYYREDSEPRVYAEDNTHAELRDVYDSNSNNTIYSEEKYNYSDIQLKHKQRKPINKVKVAIIAVEILAIVFCLLLPFMGMHTSKKKLKEQRITKAPTAVPSFTDDKIPVGAYSVQVKDYYIDNSEYWNLPDNYVVYAVSYKTQHDGTEYTSLYNCAQVYLETTTGIDISPLESYDAKKLMTKDRYETMEKNIADYIKSDGGIFYFVLKEDEKVFCLCFNVYDYDEDDHYKEIDTIYYMYLPELEVE